MRGEPEQVYQLSIKVNTMQQLLTQSSRKAELVNEQLGVLLRHTFADEKESTLKKFDELPLQVKADILRSYKDEMKNGFIPYSSLQRVKPKEQTSSKPMKKLNPIHFSIDYQPHRRIFHTSSEDEHQVNCLSN